MRIRLPRRWAALAAAAALLAGAGTWTAVASDGEPPVHREDTVLAMPGARIDTSFFTAGGGGRRPAVLLGHGFGGAKDDVRGQAEQLARDGYAVLTWTARGFGASGGRIGLNDPDHEVKDVRRLVDWLAKRPEVRLDAPGDPRVGVSGASYGGAISLLAAGYDRRVDAIAPQITYWNLADALFPDGVFKKLWAGIFFTTGAGTGPGTGPGAGVAPPAGERPPAGDAPASGPDTNTGTGAATGPGAGAAGGARPAAGRPAAPPAAACGRFQPELCALYERVAVSGRPDAAARALLEARSPSAVADRIKVPTLVVQGRSDSLFPLSHADAIAEAVAGNGAPVAVDWIAGGHDGGDAEAERVHARITDWFDRYLKGDTTQDTGPAFRVSRSGGVDSTDGRATLRGATADRYPGLRAGARALPLAGPTQTFRNPAGANPPGISAVPGVSGGLSQLSSLGVGVSVDFPGQHARFETPPLGEPLRVTGSPTVRVRVAADSGEAVLFGKVYDVGPDGRQQVLPAQLVAPVRVGDVRAGRPVELTLPAIDHEVEAGHRLRLVLAATDLGYASPVAPAAYTVSLAGGGLSVPTAPTVRTEAAGLPWWVWGLPAAGALVAAALLLTARRRTAAPAPDPELADVPLTISGLTKRYAGSTDAYAVRDLSFRVEKGQVLGLLGPNGAGKTTTLRMLMGLIAPDDGEVRVFGHAIRPGAPVLSRVGAFVEGAGFLPHLSGRENLELYWRATGRPAADTHLDEALEIAGLGGALARAVRTYSQGMRQRLAIAQAMLGLPDLLILDEPTNGLDPPQIREMRDVMIRYAAGGRTVIVSSHLLSEVEQSCTHLVVMDRGRLVQAGPVAEITGSGDTLLVTTEGDPPDQLVEKVGALPGVGSATRTEGGLLVRLDGATAAALVADLVRLDVPVTGVGPHRRLEDAFLTLIGGGGTA
ncbi:MULTISPECIES: alpha/beta fold hydrolase [Streptomyces]|uniref:ABC transporter ATP-binding protein n=2 Tax=Streptomyces TaxID=1883 RepID=A0A100Y6L6_9ACTN|nr:MULTISPECIES: alpha/beta fold hydrolase [Streptomyces]KUH38666.1 ABC transporter ATP-binding protein [Streptomyces kanasensis]UUS31146.1 alpha/beta fold hydrolase [Streptomyces changanensis]